ncbi:MAG: hypothetical protein M1499_04835 [Firmicutes bacterium]|nr:hypothetical protein [Bacillota bacterium]
MLNQQENEYGLYKEGNLARTWEKKLRPKVTPRPRRKFNGLAQTVFWIMGVWAVGLGASLLAIHVLVMGYQVDALSAQYTVLTRQNQVLAAKVTQLSSPQMLAADSQKYHVDLKVPTVRTGFHIAGPAVVESTPWYGRVSQWILALRQALVAK